MESWNSFICFVSLVLLNVLTASSANQCRDPPSLPNGHTAFNDANYAVYVCDSGYFMDIEQDSVVLLCNASSGEWSGMLPNCNPIRCPDPVVPNFGSVVGSERSYGDNVTFSCENNYRLLDPTVSSTCTQHGNWSLETPKCFPDLSDTDLCPSGSWNYENKTCIRAMENDIPWATARDTCASTQPGTPYGQLAKIPDQSTQDFIREKLNGRAKFYWIGALEGLKWYWEESNTELKYFSWADGEPNSPADIKICVQLSGFSYPSGEFHNYDWNDEDCTKASYSDSGKQNFFVCEFEQDCRINDQDLASYTQVTYGQNCAVFVRQQNSWDDARSYCSGKSGRLVMVTTEVQQQLLVTTVKNEDDGSHPNWWIGGFRDDTRSNDELLWVDGTVVSEAFWYPGEPSDAFEKCINLLSNENSFLWNDDRCTNQYGYLCQYPGSHGPQQCSDPGAPAHGTYNSSHADWLFGSYITFSCDDGYELEGEERIDCGQNGSYSDDRPECKPISCSSSHPTLPNSSPYWVNTFVYRSVVVYLCLEEYIPVGDVTSVCQADGSWSQPTGRCEANTTNRSPGTEKSTTQFSGTGRVTTPSSRTANLTSASPSLGTGNATTPSLGTVNTTTPSLGTVNATTPSSGTGNTTTVFSRTTASTGTIVPKSTVTLLPPQSTPSNNDTITLQCGHYSMTVTIPLGLVSGVTRGEDLHLLPNVNCSGMFTDDENFISIMTNLTDCGTTIKELDDHIVYSNTVVERESSSSITRLPQVYVPFSCSYNRSERVGLRSYQITNYKLNITEFSSGHYAFALDVFKDEDFEEKYEDSEYPVDMNLNENLYFGASVPSQDGTLDLSIRSCVATPSASYKDEQWTIIRDGCAVEMSTHIDSGALGFVGVTMNTFRFVELGDRVYIHCDLLVCQATTGNETSECDPACVRTAGNRARRDVITKYSLEKKRITKGPLRLRRSSNLNPSLKGKFDSEEKPALSQNFNPWIMTTIVMATFCVIIVVMLVVLLRKMEMFSRRMNLSTVEDEACEALVKS